MGSKSFNRSEAINSVLDEKLNEFTNRFSTMDQKIADLEKKFEDVQQQLFKALQVQSTTNEGDGTWCCLL